MVAACLLGLAVCAAPAQAAPDPPPTPALKLKAPDAAVRLFGASPPWLWLSALFAPAVENDRVVAVPVINTSTEDVKLTATFVPTNGLAMAHTPSLALSSVSGTAAGAANILASPGVSIPIPRGDTAQLKLALGSSSLPAGLYTGQLQFVATSNDKTITQSTSVEVRIRHSAVCALSVIVLGILLGRLSQLVYAPQMVARMQLFDRVLQLDQKIVGIADAAVQGQLLGRLNNIRAKLSDGDVDPAKLQAEFQTLADDVSRALLPPAAGAAAPQPEAGAPSQPNPAVRWISTGLRALAGVTLLPLQTVYNWLLPILVLITFVVLTIMFMVQQYGGTGTAETFGSGGIADYAGLFLAGVASEAIAGGLRAIKK